MKNKKINSAAVKMGGGLLAGMLAPGVVHACACGCGVFDVGTSSMFPEGAGGMAFLQYDYSDQNRNWSGTSEAPAANNGDKEIATDFVTAGLQYLFNPSWGVQVEVPYDYRSFKTTSNAPGNPVTAINWSRSRRHPAGRHLHGIFCGPVRRRDVRSQVADRRLDPRKCLRRR